MRVIVTGSSGYIGSVLTPLLAAAGHEVWGIDVGYFKDCVLGELPDSGVSRHICCDLRDVTLDHMTGVDAIIHLGALSNDPIGALNPLLTSEVNFRASVAIARLAKQAGVQRFIFSSSCSIYGRGASAVLTEQDVQDPRTAYAESKVSTEREVARLADDSFSPVFLRNATAYGLSPRLRLDLAVNNLTGWAVTTGHVKLLSDGSAWRPFVHCKDIAHAAIAAMTAAREVVHNEAFNVGREEDNYKIRDLAELVARIVPNSDVTFPATALADDRNYRVSFAKIRRALPQFRPAFNVEQGIRELAHAYEIHGLTKADLEGSRYIRLNQLKRLVASNELDSDLRWT